MTAVVAGIEASCPGGIVEQVPGWITVRRESLLNVVRSLKEGPAAFISLHGLTAVDRKDFLEVVYHLHSFDLRMMLTIKVVLQNQDLSISSLTPLWESANWPEREVFDLFGVRFVDHPDLRRILNPDEWTEHPLRKDFKRADFILKPVK